MFVSKSNCSKNHRYRNVARVLGKVGQKGEVKVEAIDGLPFLLQPQIQVYLTPPPLDGIRSSIVESVRELGNAWAVKFKDSNNSSDAFELKGRLCLVAEEDLPKEDLAEDLADFLEKEINYTDLIGLEVVDEKLGYLGKVVDLIESSAQVALVVFKDLACQDHELEAEYEACDVNDDFDGNLAYRKRELEAEYGAHNANNSLGGNNQNKPGHNSRSHDKPERSCETIIPLVDEFVRDFDQNGNLVVSIPRSLIGLND